VTANAERVIVGIDLSGPANAADTAVVWFFENKGTLEFAGDVSGASDADIVSAVTRLRTPVVGLDAPLSYNPGGGFRPSDTALQKETIRAGMRPGSVMAPTFNRMAYLTLRGIVVARTLEATGLPRQSIVEVHPGAAFALHGAPIEDVLGYGKVQASRVALLNWLRTAGLQGVPDRMSDTSHCTAACGAALAAWKWTSGLQKWCRSAIPPHHPYDFAC
jgi:uncharacterized protein